MNYFDLYTSGELLLRVREAYRRLAACDLCPHDCGVNRIKGERGICGAGLRPKIASANVHHGEEPPISGTKGSGTIFLSGCSLKCVFCQNFPISQFGNGQEIATRELADRMLILQKKQVHNINFVTPTHFLPQILAALWLAVPRGFSLPIVWNTSGYDKVDALQLLDGIVSIYLPDMKYSDDNQARFASAVPDYCLINRAAVMEMFRQVGHLRLNVSDIAESGLVIRHLVLPGDRSGSRETLQWIAANIGRETNIALMSQYFPAHQASIVAEMNRTLNTEEYNTAVEALEEAGLENGWVQDLDEERGAV
ncbi:MAG: radical SAM protein [Desulfuromonadaceae bacterium]|nr:radical SAM protein [Desulfuromonadaceae bacterium]